VTQHHKALILPGDISPSRCLEIFEDFCLVTQSVRAGVDVSVDVEIGEPVA
jgi:hypothetical protein